MSDRIYVRVTMRGKEASRELICDQIKIADLTYQEVASAIIEVTKILRHGRGDEIVLRVAGQTIKMGFIDAISFVMQATSTLRY